MSALSRQQISKLKKQLSELRSELQRLIDSTEDGAKPVSLEQPIGRLSRMDALQQQSMSQASQQVAMRRLEQIKAALHRIAVGGYGFCLACEEEIEFARLQARPEAPFCIDCQSSRERRS